MIRSAPSISTTGPGRALPGGGSTAADPPRGRRATAPSARGRGPWRRRRWQSACRVRLRERGRSSRLVMAGPAGVHRAPVPAALYLRGVGPSAAARAPAVPDALARTRSSRTATRSCSSPSATGASSAASAPSTTTPSTPSTPTAGACSASSSSRTIRRSCPPLLDAAAGWLREHGRDHMIGPMDFTINDESGVMVEGFEREPMIKQPWHPPYYQPLLRGGRAREGDGPVHVRARDLRPPTDPADRLQARRAGRAAPRHHAPQDDAALAAQRHGPLRRGLQRRPGARTGASRPTARRTSTPRAGDAAGVRLATGSWSPRRRRARPPRSRSRCPDINQVLEKMNGRLLPLGWWHFLRRAKTIDRVRVGLPRRQAGVPAHRASRRRCTSSTSTPPPRRPQKWGEMGWILETNNNMNRAMEAMGGRIVRRFGSTADL